MNSKKSPEEIKIFYAYLVKNLYPKFANLGKKFIPPGESLGGKTWEDLTQSGIERVGELLNLGYFYTTGRNKMIDIIRREKKGLEIINNKLIILNNRLHPKTKSNNSDED